MKKILTLICMMGLMCMTAFADPTDGVPVSTEMVMTETIEDTVPEESQISDTEPTETEKETISGTEERTETRPASGTNSLESYCHINVITQFAEDVNPEEFTGYKVILTPVDFTYMEDTGVIPDDYMIPNTMSMNGEEYETYELVSSHLTDYKSEVDIAGTRILNIEFTEPNILAQDIYTYTPLGDDFIEVDMGDSDPMGYFVGKTYLMKNEPGKEKNLHVLISKNPNPKKPNINDAEISDKDKEIVDAAINGAQDDDVDITTTVITDIPETKAEKTKRILFATMIVGGIAVAICGLAYLYIKRIKEEDE